MYNREKATTRPGKGVLPVHPETPTRTVYLATREDDKPRIIGPGGQAVEAAMSSRGGGTFTATTLAEHLGWVKNSTRDGSQPTTRFHAAFNALATFTAEAKAVQKA